MSRTRRTRQGSPDAVNPLFWALLCDAVPLDDPRRRDPTLKWRFWEFGADQQLGGGIPSQGYIAAMWAESRDYILHHWTRDHPGTRPQSFWRFDVEAPSVAYWSETGLPTTYGPPIGMTEVEYLDRHNLLTENERRRIAGVAGPSRGAHVKIKVR